MTGIEHPLDYDHCRECWECCLLITLNPKNIVGALVMKTQKMSMLHYVLPLLFDSFVNCSHLTWNFVGFQKVLTFIKNVWGRRKEVKGLRKSDCLQFHFSKKILRWFNWSRKQIVDSTQLNNSPCTSHSGVSLTFLDA